MSNAHPQQAFHLMYRDDGELSAHHVDVPGISGTMRFRRRNKPKMNLRHRTLVVHLCQCSTAFSYNEDVAEYSNENCNNGLDLCLPRLVVSFHIP